MKLKPIRNPARKNRRGQVMGIIIFFLILFSVLIIGFMIVMGTSILGLASEQITPIMEGIGVIEVNTETGAGVNVSQAAQYSFGVLDTAIQALPWVVGFLLVAALIFSVVFAITYTSNPHPAFIGLYILLTILLIFGAIILSNMYQDIYTSGDELAVKLHEQTLSSYIILHSPVIIVVISLLTGIFLFIKPPEEGGAGI